MNGRECLLLLALLVTLAGCATDSADQEADRRPDDDAVDDDDVVECPNEYCVFEGRDPAADWDCATPESCTIDYLSFVWRASEHARPISESELARQLDAIRQGRVNLFSGALPEDELTDWIVEICNVEFLRQGIDRRPLYMTITVEEQNDDYILRELLFEDPYVGKFKGILLLPRGTGPFPGVIALHGHCDDAQDFMNSYGGVNFPEHGLAILMITSRAMGDDRDEDLVTRTLLLNGFTFMGLREYEALLGLKYLRYLAQVDDDRIGLIGHSGGSVAGNLIVRIEPGLRAYVSDLVSQYMSMDPEQPLLDETVPALYPFHLVINDFSSCSTPVLQVPYGYTSGMDEIFEFFEQQLVSR